MKASVAMSPTVSMQICLFSICYNYIMLSLREYITQSSEKKIAIGHFNASTLDGIWAIADAGLKLSVPVIVGFSEGERDYIGVRQAVEVVRSIRKERDQPIFLNADHTYSFERVKEAIDAGFDAVIFDGAKLSFDENVAIARKCVGYAKEFKEKTGRDVLVEGELGFIGTSSKVMDEMPAGVAIKEEQMTDPDDALKFVKETGVDLLAPSVGNVHGMVRTGNPALNINRLRDVAEKSGVPIVLHGASGNTADDVRSAVKAGAAIVHVNTELRVAYRSALVKSLSEDREEVSPYKYLKPAKLAMQKVVEDKIGIIV